jgi:hypothetical protein
MLGFLPSTQPTAISDRTSFVAKARINEACRLFSTESDTRGIVIMMADLKQQEKRFLSSTSA